MVEDPANPALAARESDLKVFFVSQLRYAVLEKSCGTIIFLTPLISQTRLHEMFVQYTMNPFTKLREQIVSKRFDDGVTEAMSVYNNTHEVGA